MALRRPARVTIASRLLDERSLIQALRRTLPAKNNYCPINCSEILKELSHFGVHTRGQFRRLMLRHRRKAISIDREPMDETNNRIYRSELGDAKFSELEKRQMFFGWEGLVRIVLELEYGDAYRDFAQARDAA